MYSSDSSAGASIRLYRFGMLIVSVSLLAIFTTSCSSSGDTKPGQEPTRTPENTGASRNELPVRNPQILNPEPFAAIGTGSNLNIARNKARAALLDEIGRVLKKSINGFAAEAGYTVTDADLNWIDSVEDEILQEVSAETETTGTELDDDGAYRVGVIYPYRNMITIAGRVFESHSATAPQWFSMDAVVDQLRRILDGPHPPPAESG